MAKENSLGRALMALPLWAKILLCLVDIVYGAERIVEAADKKSTLAIIVSVVWLFVYPVNLIVDLLLIVLRGRWLSFADLFPSDNEGTKKDAIDVEFTEKDHK